VEGQKREVGSEDIVIEARGLTKRYPGGTLAAAARRVAPKLPSLSDSPSVVDLHLVSDVDRIRLDEGANVLGDLHATIIVAKD
jgi:hypothetical protein